MASGFEAGLQENLAGQGFWTLGVQTASTPRTGSRTDWISNRDSEWPCTHQMGARANVSGRQDIRPGQWSGSRSGSVRSANLVQGESTDACSLAANRFPRERTRKARLQTPSTKRT